jgi:ArsR family transcriptional regulator, virulence genes transcriptional regulator
MKLSLPKLSTAKASKIANVLRVLANERRLILLVKMMRSGEATVTSLAEAAGLSQSATSQHLGKMRAAGLIAFRRDGATLWYRVADARILHLIGIVNAGPSKSQALIRMVCGARERNHREHEAGTHEIFRVEGLGAVGQHVLRAFTTRIKPKLTTNCSSIVIPTMLMPGVAIPCNTAMTIGIMADASAVAPANPRWIKVRNRVSTARTNSAVAFLRPNSTTARSASQDAPLVCSNAVPTLMPIPNSTIVPHGILGCASFQVMMPMPGRNISATAAMVVDEVSKL